MSSAIWFLFGCFLGAGIALVSIAFAQNAYFKGINEGYQPRRDNGESWPPPGDE